MIEMLEGHWEKFKALEKLQDVLSSGICKQYGITQTAFQIIIFLSQFPEHNTAKEICSIRCIKSSNASMTIDKLVKNDFVMKKNDSADRRIQRLELTSKGESVARDGKKILKEFMGILFGDLTKEEYQAFFQIINKMHDSIVRAIREKKLQI